MDCVEVSGLGVVVEGRPTSRPVDAGPVPRAGSIFLFSSFSSVFEFFCSEIPMADSGLKAEGPGEPTYLGASGGEVELTSRLSINR